MAFISVDPINFEPVSNVTSTNSVEVGTRRIVGDEKYIYVYNNGNSQVSVGRGVVVSALSGYSVTVSSVSGDFAIGFCKHATMATAQYGWVVTHGFVDGCTNGMASTAIAGTDLLVMGADGSVAKDIATAVIVGKPMSATGSAGTLTAYICLF